MPLYTSLCNKAERHVTEMFHNHQQVNLPLHNLNHTETVVKKVTEIAKHYNLGEEDMAVVYVAAWFHDTGYLFEKAETHELKSVDLMKEFLTNEQISEEVINKTARCILATRAPRNPQLLTEEILCDADTYQFGSKPDFKKTNQQAFEELFDRSGFTLLKIDFDKGTLKMLLAHKYYTSYCKELLNDVKKENIKSIKKSIKKDYKQAPVEKIITEKDGTTKGMQTMLRLTSSNHIKLSEMADSKANILISVNAIIISIILGVLLRKLQTDPYLTIPTVTFLASSVITIVVAILATRPKLNTGTFEDEDVVNKKTNLLFFGNFHKMTYLQYDNAMRTMMKDSDYLYSSIVQDIFHLGQVLGKKYKLIRLAYNIFMYGIIISVIAFTVSVLLNTGTPETAVVNASGSPF